MWFYTKARIMFPTALKFQGLCFIMLQITLNVEKSGSSVLNNHTNSWESVFKDSDSMSSARSKRGLTDKMPNELKIRVRYETGEEIDLKWIKGRQLLANQNLPIKTLDCHSNPNVMKDVGEFVIYHDPVKSSAVVYFMKLQSFFGVIGMNYYVTYLPYKFNSIGEYLEVVGAPYVLKHEYTPTHHHPLFPESIFRNFLEQSNHEPDGTTGYSSDFNSDPSANRQRTEQDFEETDDEVSIADVSNIKMGHWNPFKDYYLEILVFVTHDVAETFKGFYGADHYIEWIVRYYILYFNAVDMMLKKLRTARLLLQINIAKIVIQDSDAFGFMGDDQSEFNDIVSNVQQYLHIHQFPPNSFDHVFVSTRHPILRNTARVLAATKLSGNLAEALNKGEFYSAVPITAVDFDDHYVLAVQEISLIFNIKIDDWDKRLTHAGQCASIMQEGSSRCDNCLVWKYRHRIQFIEFFRHDRNRCFLLNEPRSLRPFGPSPFLTPYQQCQCFGDSDFMKYRGILKRQILVNDCMKPLQCENYIGGRVHTESTVRPFDGTRCIHHTKVCWDGKCMKYRRR